MEAEERESVLWQQRELIASRTLTELANKQHDKKEEKERPQTNAGEDSSFPQDNMEEEYSSSSSSESSSFYERPPSYTWKKKEGAGPSVSVSSPASSLNSLPHSKSSSLPSTRTTEEEVLDIAHALEDLSYIERKRTFVTGDSLIISPKPKKRRRKRHEIVRNWKCTVNGCNKSYGSEGALKTHVKLKHTSMSISDIPNVSSPVRPWILSKSPFSSPTPSTSSSTSSSMNLGAGIGPSPTPSSSTSTLPSPSTSISSSVSLPSIHNIQFAGDDTNSAESKKASAEGNVFPLIESKSFPFTKSTQSDSRALPLPRIKEQKATLSPSRPSYYPSASLSSSLPAASLASSSTPLPSSTSTAPSVPFPFAMDSRFNFVRSTELPPTAASTENNNKGFPLSSTRSLAQLLNSAIDSKFKF